MRILQANTTDINGGAAMIAWELHQAYRRMGHESCMAVGRKASDDPDVIELGMEHRRTAWRTFWGAVQRRSMASRTPGLWRLQRILTILAQGWPGWRAELGLEVYDFPNSRALLKLRPDPPDLLHGHNLHGGYFDLRCLSALSQAVPTCLTLHDEWLLTGHCAYALGCSRWATGCGRCPDLTIPVAQKRDATGLNWHRKHRIVARSRLHLATPSRWLAKRVQASGLKCIDCRVIPNGVDLAVFQPGDRLRARAELGLPQGGQILLFVAHGMQANPFKDYATVERAALRLAAPANDVLLILMGGMEAGQGQLGAVCTLSVPFSADRARVATWYQAADVFVHAAHMDNFPNTVLEALACGVPIVATAVGGVPEQIDVERTGILVPPHDDEAMASAVARLLADRARCAEMGATGRLAAEERFGVERMALEYLGWYKDVASGFPGHAKL